MSDTSDGSDGRVAGEAPKVRLAFDVTGLVARSGSRPTGIERVMLEIAVSLAHNEPAEIEFCAFDTTRRRFVHISTGSVLELGVLMRGSTPSDQSSPRDPANSRSSAKKNHGRRFITQFPSASQHIRRALGHARNVRSEARQFATIWFSSALVPLRRVLGQSGSDAECCSTRWTASTTYCSVDPVFAEAMIDHLADRRSDAGFRVLLMIHDLIPSLAPQYVTWNDDSAAIRTIEIADVLIVNSDATLRDTQTFADAHQLALPLVVKLPMASALRDLQPAEPPTQPGQRRLYSGRFVLSVGTVTIRKNQQLLLDVWEQMVAARGKSDVPTLVVAGRRGWLYDETMSRLEHTPALHGVVHHLADASDENIAWLYEHCAFTVFPSLYEGWGLPVSESLDFGKVCLTSDRTSLPEAAEGLAECLDPTDRTLWLERVLHYWTNREARVASEKEIRARHRRVAAEDSALTVLRAAQAVDV